MKFLSLTFLFTAFFGATSFTQNNSNCAEQLIRQSIEAVGGEKAIKSLLSLSYKVDGYRNLVEQSERPEGPPIPGVQSKEIVIDFVNKRFSQKISGASVVSGLNSYTIFDKGFIATKRGNIFIPARQNTLLHDVIETETIYVLLVALKSQGLSCGKDTILQKQVQHTVRFLWQGYPVRIFLSATTHFITAVEVSKPYNELFIDIWGDSRKITFFSFWYLLSNGVSYALQTDTYINGWHYQTALADNKSVMVNLPAGDSLVIPDSTIVKIRNLPPSFNEQVKQQVRSRKVEIAKDIWLIPGPCNVTILKQNQSVVIIEAPVSSAYSAFIVELAKELYPGLPISCIISTSDAWLHMGGLREYAALHSRIWCLDLNKWIIDKLLRSPYITQPDSWVSKYSSKQDIQIVSGKTVVGTGPNRFELYPFRTETGERMMMAYFPEHKIIYASDLFQPKSRNGKYWNNHYTLEVIKAIEREKITVRKLYAMHSGILEYDGIKGDFIF